MYVLKLTLNVLGKLFLPLLQIIYSPLIPYVSKYGVYEQNYLLFQLSEIKCIKDELPETVQTLSLTIPMVMDMAQEARKRCQSVTENCGYCGLLLAFRSFFLSYADQYRMALVQIERKYAQQEDWGLFQLCLSLLQNTGDVLLNIQKLEKELTSTVVDLATVKPF